MAKTAIDHLEELIGQYHKVLRWVATAGFVAPLAPIIANLGPPWGTGGSEAVAKASVAIITAFAQAIALMAALLFAATAVGHEGRKRLLKRALVFCGVSFLVYVTVFILLTESPKHTSQRYVTGFVTQDSFQSVVKRVGGDVERGKDAVGRKPLRIWVPWTVYTSMVLVVVAWICFFGGFVFFTGAFIKAYPRVSEEADREAETRALLDLGLQSKTRRILEAEGMVTIGDLASKTRREVSDIGGIGDAVLAEIELSLTKLGLKLRDDVK